MFPARYVYRNIESFLKIYIIIIMLSIKHNNNQIQLIKIFSSYLEKIKEISTTITASFGSSYSNGSGFLVILNDEI
jgi:hypothetical protein